MRHPRLDADNGTHSWLIRVIDEHNALNGYRFAAWEFGMAGCVATLIAASAFVSSRPTEGCYWLGVAINTAVVAFRAVHHKGGMPEVGIRQLLDPSTRRSVGEHHPGLLRRTTVLVIATFVPLLLLMGHLADAWKTGGPRA